MTTPTNETSDIAHETPTIAEIPPKPLPIEEAFTRAGLVRTPTGTAPMPTNTTPRVVTQKVGGASRAFVTTRRPDTAPHHIKPPAADDKPKLALAPPAPEDPNDVMDDQGFTPNMRRWLAIPGAKELVDILMFARPKGSANEGNMVRKYIYSLLDTESGIRMSEDIQGNIVIDVGENPHGVMFSCHTDSVHSEWHDRRQSLVLTRDGFLRLHNTETANCLGADDGTGVWLMREMIKGGVAGRYIFHYGEESGCIGSNWLRRNRPDLLAGIRFAVAFDRQGYSDIITHQRGSRSASDAFAHSIAAQFKANNPSFNYKPEHGIYTDTAVYMEMIPECTNISVGYFGAHGDHERQDMLHALALRDALLTIDPSQWVCERVPGPPEWAKPKARASNFRVLRTPQYTSTVADDLLDAIDREYGIDTRRGQKALRRIIRRQAQEDLEETFRDLETGDGISRLEESFPTRGRDVFLDRQRKKKEGSDMEEQKAYEAEQKAYQDKVFENFRSDAPRKPDSLHELIQLYGREVADHLEQDGFSVIDFWPGILSALGFRKQ